MLQTLPATHSTLLSLQDAIARHLRRRKELRNVPILVRRNGDAGQKLREALAARGLCIVILPALPEKAEPLPGAVSVTRLAQKVRVIENAYRGHPQFDALGLAELISRVLHGWTPPLSGITTPLTLEADDPWDMPDEPDSHGRFKIDVHFLSSAIL